MRATATAIPTWTLVEDAQHDGECKDCKSVAIYKDSKGMCDRLEYKCKYFPTRKDVTADHSCGCFKKRK